MILFRQTELTKYEKEQLKNFKNSPVYAVIKKVEADQKVQLGNAILRCNLDNEDERNFIKTAQIYARAREEFIHAIENNSLDTLSFEKIP